MEARAGIRCDRGGSGGCRSVQLGLDEKGWYSWCWLASGASDDVGCTFEGFWFSKMAFFSW